MKMESIEYRHFFYSQKTSLTAVNLKCLYVYDQFFFTLRKSTDKFKKRFNNVSTRLNLLSKNMSENKY